LKSTATQTGWLFYLEEKVTAKEEILEILRKCAKKLEHAPSYNELKKMTNASRRNIRRHFGSYTMALRAAGLDRRGGGVPIDLEYLFPDWARVVRALGKLPSIADYEQLSKYSAKPLMTRYRSWLLVPRGLYQYAEEQRLERDWPDVLELIRSRHQLEASDRLGRWQGPPAARPPILADRPMYGSPIGPAPLAHGPLNELGVIYLFGTLAGHLGFVVTRIQAEFPDCEAMRQVDADKWQRVRIEFEFESKNFLKHGHQVRECDLIVCWKHNWETCPLEVLELKKIVNAQQQALKPNGKFLEPRETEESPSNLASHSEAEQ
jgi:HNH endonuclease